MIVSKWRVTERRSVLVVVVGMIAIIMSMTVVIRTSLEGGRDIIRATITMLIVIIVILFILIIIVAVVAVNIFFSFSLLFHPFGNRLQIIP